MVPCQKRVLEYIRQIPKFIEVRTGQHKYAWRIVQTHHAIFKQKIDTNRGVNWESASKFIK